MTHAERIFNFLAARPGTWFDDDQLSAALRIQPRQAVNQVCRRLAAEGRIARERREGKIHNALAAGRGGTGSAPPPQRAAAPARHTGPEQAEAAALLHQCAAALVRLNAGQAAGRLREAAAGADPRQALVACRWALERLLAAEGAGSLAEAIDRWASAPGGEVAIIRSHMHTVRALGNEAVHGAATVAWADARVGAGALLQAVSRLTLRTAAAGPPSARSGSRSAGR